jgi:hypothetical protein
MSELPCLPSLSAPAQPVMSKKLLANYDERLALYESQFLAYRTWLD